LGAALCASMSAMRATIFTVASSWPGTLSTMARPRGGEWLADEMAALRVAGTDILVSMLTASELRELELTEEAASAEASGIRFISLPTPDRGTPGAKAFRALVTELVEELASGRHVVVHCRMGIGRSSLVAAGCLLAQGMAAEEAWAAISDARGLAVPDTPEQRRWLQRAMGPG
jgi:protein-tyrosine phosphatase